MNTVSKYYSISRYLNTFFSICICSLMLAATSILYFYLNTSQ